MTPSSSESAVESRLPSFAQLRELGLATRSDPEILDFSARQNWIVVSHDVNTMRHAARGRLEAGHPMSGLLLAHQALSVSAVIDSLLLIWSASDAEEWSGQVEFLPI